LVGCGDVCLCHCLNRRDSAAVVVVCVCVCVWEAGGARGQTTNRLTRPRPRKTRLDRLNKNLNRIAAARAQCSSFSPDHHTMALEALEEAVARLLPRSNIRCSRHLDSVAWPAREHPLRLLLLFFAWPDDVARAPRLGCQCGGWALSPLAASHARRATRPQNHKITTDRKQWHTLIN
jgi:hypothetical protein